MSSRGFAKAWVGALVLAALPAAAQDAGVATGDAGAPVTVDAGTPAVVGTPAPPSFLDTTDRRIVDTRPAATAEQIAGLHELEAEVARFSEAGESYRSAILSLVRRQYLRQRRGRDQWFARQIRAEEGLMDEARLRAIEEFERFIAQYPNDQTYTADAMFRLGELYYERSALAFQSAYDAAQEARDRGETVEAADIPDFSDTIALYRRLVTQFPNYRRLDGVFYLIGYCLNEMGQTREAVRAWLSLVCHNNFAYDPTQFAAETAADAEAHAAEDEAAATAPEHPAAVAAIPEDPNAPFVDPYLSCEPVNEETQFVSETWFRVGEFHFDDYGGAHSLDLAIAAYGRILTMPDDRNYNLALYKVAWAYYRASKYADAIRHFGMLVQWSDDEHARTGQAGSQLRPEAVEYLGIAFAYDDWNENGLPDVQEGEQDGIARVQNASLLPQDREWTPEVYFELGRVYFDEARYPEAIRIWEIALSRWGRHARAPEITSQIALAHERHNEFDEARTWRFQLSNFGEGSEWWQQNLDNPEALRNAEHLAESALIQVAIHEHTTAQRLRRQSVELVAAGENADALARFDEAKNHYVRAATAYREYLRRYPNNPQAYELQFNLADALYWSEQYEESATEYGAVRDSNLDDTHLSEAARMVVESIRQVVDQASRRGDLVARTEPPTAVGTPPAVVAEEMPMLLQRFAQAREMYLARVTDAQDREGVRAAYDYNNAVLLYQYGYWPQAKERFQRIFEERCAGPYANETGQVAWESLREMAIALEQNDEIERLARALSERACTFEANGQACATGPALEQFCSQSNNSNHRCCLAQRDLTAIEFRRAVEVFDRAQLASGTEQIALYEQAATLLVEAVNRTPGHPQAPVALERAATALEETQRFDSARQLYRRIIDEVGPRQAENGEEQASLDRIVANAYFRVAFTANRGFEFDEAVQNYRVLVDSPRFRGSDDERIKVFRRDALVNTAIIFERLQRYDDALRYFRLIIDSPDADADLKRLAAFRIAEIAFTRGNHTLAIREMRSFATRYQADRAAGELVVQSYWRIAQSRKALNQTRDYTRALEDVVAAFARSSQDPGSIAADYAASAQFLLTNEGFAEFERLTINPGRPATLEAYAQGLTSQINQAATRTTEFANGYNGVLQYRRPTWQIAALVQRGRVFETLARAVLNAPFTIPADLQRQMGRVGPDAREDIRIQVEDRVRAVLDSQTRPIECLAVAEYALAARAARVGSLSTDYSQTATDRLQAYGDERINECITQRQQTDPSFGNYTQGEFARAPRGQVLDVPTAVAPPSLVE